MRTNIFVAVFDNNKEDNINKWLLEQQIETKK